MSRPAVKAGQLEVNPTGVNTGRAQSRGRYQRPYRAPTAFKAATVCSRDTSRGLRVRVAGVTRPTEELHTRLGRLARLQDPRGYGAAVGRSVGLGGGPTLKVTVMPPAGTTGMTAASVVANVAGRTGSVEMALALTTGP